MGRYCRYLGIVVLAFLGFHASHAATAHATSWQAPPVRSRPTAVPPGTLTPAQYTAMVQALHPLPTFGPYGKGQFPVQRVEVQTQQVLPLVLDGEEVLLWSYLIRPLYDDANNTGMDTNIRGELGMALFAAQSQLLWRVKLQDLDYLSQVAIAAEAVPLPSTTTGLLYQTQLLYAGSGAGTDTQTTLYRWTGQAFTVIWQNRTGESQALGVGYHTAAGEQVTVRDLDEQGWPELVLRKQRSLRAVNWQDAQLTQDFWIYLPGALALGWDGQRYGLRYFVDRRGLIALHDHWPVRFAPRLHTPLTIDGNIDDWRQLEYLDEESLTVQRELQTSVAQWPHDALVAWDERNLYVRSSMMITQPLQIAIDADLQTDYADTGLSADDVVMQLALAATGAPPKAVVTIEHPLHELPIAVATQEAWAGSGVYQVEVAIPLAALGLAADTLVTAPGWVGYRPSPYSPTGARLYYPATGAVLGFAVAIVDEADAFVADPTTWPALILMDAN